MGGPDRGPPQQAMLLPVRSIWAGPKPWARPNGAKSWWLVVPRPLTEGQGSHPGLCCDWSPLGSGACPAGAGALSPARLQVVQTITRLHDRGCPYEHQGQRRAATVPIQNRQQDPGGNPAQAQAWK